MYGYTTLTTIKLTKRWIVAARASPTGSVKGPAWTVNVLNDF